MIDQKTILHIAQLARLHVTEADAQAHAGQLSKALDYFEQISTVDVQNVEPLVTPCEIEMHLREDRSEKLYSAQEMAANAPEKSGHLFKVPPVV